jgi:hypothetical protein
MEWDIEPKHPGGRPTKRTPEITDQICEAISYGLTDEEVAAMVGIDDSTLTCWKKIPEFSGVPLWLVRVVDASRARREGRERGNTWASKLV